MEKLPKKFKKQFVDALKSGKYQQGKHALKKEGKYCCLGVAGEIAGNTNLDCGWLEDDLHKRVPKILCGNTGVPSELAGLNDYEIPFEVIAGVVNEWL